MKLNKLGLLKKEFSAGQTEFQETIKFLLSKKNKKFIHKLNLHNHSTLLEPLLFAYFNSKKPLIRLEQILFGYFDSDKRPKITKVYSDSNGVVYLPELGYLISSKKNKSLELRARGRATLTLLDNSKIIDYQFFPIIKISGHNIELCQYSNPFWFENFNKWGEEGKDLEFVKNFSEQAINAALISKALSIIKKKCPKDYQLLVESTKQIILFKSTKIRCFVTRSMHGSIFLNIPKNVNVTYYIEELVHQCSHNVFNAITADLSRYLRISSETPLVKLTKVQGESRSVYDAYHGHYTVCQGVKVLSRCINAIKRKEERLELIGRLAIKEIRFRIGLEQVDFENVFTDLGFLIYKMLDQSCEEVINSNQQIFNKYDFSNQGPVFDFDKFKIANTGLVLDISKE